MRPSRFLLIAAAAGFLLTPSGLLLTPSSLYAQSPATQPAATAAPSVAPSADAPRDIRFQFDGIPYVDVVRRFSQMVGKPLVGELNIEGTLTFFDSQPYTYAEAVDTLNTILSMRGLTLVETDRFLQLIPLKDIQSANLKVLTGTAKTTDLRPGQIVTVVMPLKYLEADVATKALQPLVSAFGKIATLSRSRGIIITDRVSNIERIRSLLVELDANSLVDRQLRTYVLVHASARDAARMINDVFKSSNAGALQKPDNQPASKLSWSVTASADDRTNTLVLVGTSDQLTMAEQLMEKLEGAGTEAQISDVRVFDLKEARAEIMLATLRQAVIPATGASAKEKEIAAAIKIIADPISNRIIASAPGPQIQTIAKLVQELDKTSKTAQIARVFRLQSADAQQLAAVVSNTFGRLDTNNKMVSRVSSNADAKTNTLIVAGAAEDMDQVEKLVADLDREQKEQARDIHIVQLQAGDARQIAGSLVRLFQQRVTSGRGTAPRMTIEPETATNSLMIACNPQDWPEVQASLEQLQAAIAPSTTPVTRIAKLKNLHPSDLVDMLRQAFVNRPKTGKNPAIPVSITGSEPTQSLIITASEDDQKSIAQLITTLDVEGSVSVQQQLRTYQLSNSKATELAEKLARLFSQQQQKQNKGNTPADIEPAPRFEADATSNQLLIAATERQFPIIEKLLDNLQAANKLATQTKTYTLKFAQAADVAQILVPMLADASGNASSPARRRGPGNDGPGSDARVAALTSTNTLVIQATPERLALAESLIKTFDVPEADQGMVVQWVHLEKAQATTLADAVNASLSDKANAAAKQAGKAATKQPTTVTAEPNSNSILVRGPASDLPTVLGMIRELDKGSTSNEASVRIYKIENSKATDLASSVGRLFSDMLKQQSTGKRNAPPPFAVSADDRTNSLVVSTTAANFALVDQIIAGLDKSPARLVQDAQIIHLNNAMASDVSRKLASMFSDRRGPNANKPVIEADDLDNSLTIIARDEDIKTMAPIIAKLDEGAKDDSIHVRVIPLSTSRADSMATTLRDIFPQISGKTVSLSPGSAVAPVVNPGVNPSGNSSAVPGSVPGAAPRANPTPATQPAPASTAPTSLNTTEQSNNAYPGGAEKGPGETAGFPPAVGIVVDKSANALIVSGTRQSLDELETLITRLSAGNFGRGEAEFRLFKINRAEPEVIARTLDELYNPKVLPQQIVVQRGGQPQPQQLPPPPPVIHVVADQRTKSLIVRAKPTDFDVIAGLIDHLDQPASVAGEVKVFTLKNTDATEVAANLKDILKLSLQPDTARNGQAEGMGQIQRAVTLRQVIRSIKSNQNQPTDDGLATSISANRQTNSVVIAAPSEVMPVLEGIIQELDQSAALSRVPSVRIYPVAHADVRTAAATLTQIFADQNPLAAGRGKGAQQGGISGAGSVTIAADVGSRILIVSAPAEKQELVAQIVSQLDQSASASVAGTYLLPLKNGDATTVAAMVRDLYQQQNQAATRAGRSLDPLAITADDRANTLVIATSAPMYQQVSEWVKQLEEMKPARGSLKILQLKSADPAEIEKAIRELFNSRSSGPQSAPGNTGGKKGGPQGKAGAAGAAGGGGDQVQVTSLPGQKSILINASDDDFQVVQKLVDALDIAAADAKPTVKLFQLKHANAMRVYFALSALYRSGQGGGQRQNPDDAVTISVVPQTTAIMVAASKKKLDEVEHLIEQLDRAEVAADLEFRVMRLQNASPTKILPLLQQMLQQVQRDRIGETINAQADERTRSIIITARGDVFAQVEKIISSLDQAPAQAEAQVAVIPLKKADATRLAALLNEMLQPGVGGKITPEALTLQEQIRLLKIRGTEQLNAPELDLSKPIKISADPAQGSNALVITSTPENIKALQSVIEMLDAAPLAEGVKVRLVHLENADATSVTTILREVFTQGQRLAGKPGSPVAGKAEPENVSGKALVNPLNISADIRTNTLVLGGSEESIALAEAIIKDLDKSIGKITTEVRLFRMNHADAAKLVPVLTAVFAELTPPAGAIPGAEGLATQVTRLKTVLSKDASHTAQNSKARPPITIQADVSTNTLVVAARSDVMPLIVDVLTNMDIPGAGSLSLVRVYPLNNADAPKVKQTIDALQTGPSAKLIRDEDKPTVVADTRTNALIISGSEKTLALIETLLPRLDAKAPLGLADVKIVELKNADALTLAPILQKMMDARVQRQTALSGKDADAAKVVVSADARSNSLLVSGSPEGYELVKLLCLQLDTQTAAFGGQVQLIPLQNANAGQVATTLTNLFTQRYAAARTPDQQRQKPVIVPDVRTNSLMVAANPDDTAILTSLLKNLDNQLSSPSVMLEVIPMKFNDAATVAPMVRNIFQSRLQSMTLPGQQPVPQDRVDIAFDQLTNALVVSASKENLQLIHGLLEKVDVQPSMESGIVKLYGLRNADAQRVATLLQSLVSQGLYKPGVATASGANAAVQARDKVAVAVDVRTNVLIVSASKENFAVIEEILKGIDNTEDFTQGGDIKLFQLGRADVTRLAPILQQFFNAKRQAEIAAAGGAQGAGGRSLPVTIVPDSRTNMLIVAGSRESFAAIENMIKKLDGDNALMLNDFRVFYLKNGSATALQTTIQQLFDQRALRDEAKRHQVTVVADGRTNALIIGGEPEDMDAADALIKRLDVQPDASGVTVQVFPLTKADALQIAATLRSLYSTQLAPVGPITPGKGGPVGSPPVNLQGEPLINISADTRLNAVVISAGQTDMAQIAELVRQLDGDVLTQVAEIRVFPLKFADAVEASTVLTTAITARAKAASAATGAQANKQQVLQFVAKPSQGGVLSTALEQDIVITPDKRTNSLVVSASVDSMPLVESLIKAMDSINTQEAQIRVFKLINADARQMADVLTQLFGLKSGGTGGQRAITYTLLATPTTQPSAAGASIEQTPTPETARATATVGNAEQYALSVTVDIRTNSLLVGGTRRYVDLVDKIILELDESPAQERMTEVYRLRNAQAVDIETALKNFLTQERDRVLAALGKDHMGAAERLLEKEVAVVAEKVSNTLLLSASPRYFKTIETMIRELDQAPPQVLIQALLAEVTLDNTTELGFEWAYKFNVAGSTATIGDNFGNMAKNPTAGNPLPVPGNNNIFPGGFSAAVTGGDLSMLFRALQNQGKLEVLSRPQILASDNQSADIIVGQRVPLPKDVRVTDTSTFTSIEYQDVGIKLIVLPRINPDGSVKLQVHPEISSLSSSTVNIPGATSSPIINNRSATTTINVQDGHTIIIGGLITSSDDNREKKVPLLGDIPILEWLFKDKTKVTGRTELLIVLTPRVLQTPGNSDSVTRKQIERLDALRNISRESLNKELDETIHPAKPDDQIKKEALNTIKPTAQTQGDDTTTKPSPDKTPEKP